MNKISALALSIIIGGCLRLSESQTSLAKPEIAQKDSIAKVTEVTATGEPDNYTFAVTVDSPDTGCSSYADWWEVITPQKELIYRRVLLHSHVDEQPFTRTGGTVAIQPEDEVIVRVHMSSDGYSDRAQQGSVASGFTTKTLPPDFASDLESVEPLPKDCAF